MALLPAPPSSSNPLLRRSLQRRSSVQFKGTPPVTHIETQEAQNIADGAEQSSKSVSAGLTKADELEKYITIREELYKKAKEFDSKIIIFETAIRRPYFHVSRVGIYLVLKLPINLHILNSHRRFTVFDILGTITINVLTCVAAII
ncbi:unnamed protein product [Malus baccata var. baccata]